MNVRLTYFKAEGLFGQYTNEIRLNLEEHITAVFAPNGRGKTMCLRLINALFQRNFRFISTIEFTRLIYRFSNNQEIEIRSIKQEEINNDNNIFDSELFSAGEDIPVTIIFKNSNGNTIQWNATQRIPKRRIYLIREYMHWISRVEPGMWFDQREGDAITSEEAMRRYSHRLPERILKQIEGDEPQEFKDAISEIECHLIETHRLQGFDEEDIESGYERRRRPEPRLGVEQKARILQRQLQQQLADYGILSQRLDRSFPHRVIENHALEASDIETIRNKLENLNEIRRNLEIAGILDEDSEYSPLIPSSIDSDTKQILSLYLKDTEDKLNYFSDILSKISLFTHIINENFIGKRIHIDKKFGFTISPNNECKKIPLDKLSSGEQHQLIMTFELLFEIKPGSLIMIDEPEISLHVSWQEKFIEDLRKIIKLNQIDVILATHSPQLIDRWFNLAIGLDAIGDGEADD